MEIDVLSRSKELEKAVIYWEKELVMTSLQHQFNIETVIELKKQLKESYN